MNSLLAIIPRNSRAVSSIFLLNTVSRVYFLASQVLLILMVLLFQAVSTFYIFLLSSCYYILNLFKAKSLDSFPSSYLYQKQELTNRLLFVSIKKVKLQYHGEAQDLKKLIKTHQKLRGNTNG